MENIRKKPECRKQIRHLKKQGIKTEPAFCYLLGLKGDPYSALLNYGVEKDYITDF